MAHGIRPSSFYGSCTQRIRFRNNGINIENRNIGILLPDADSEVEDEENEDEIENFMAISTDDVLISDADDDSDADFVPQNQDDDNDNVDDNDDEDGEGDRDDSVDNLVDCNKAPCYQWQRIDPTEVNTQFTGEPFPNPPEEEISPMRYFKQLFDDKLIDHIAEQSNSYSVQQSGKSVNLCKSELEQYFGKLLMMGLIKLPQYRMFWANGTRIPAIAEAMSVNRFDKIKQFLHCNDNAKMVPKGDPSYDKLFKVRPVLDSVLKNCKKIPQEEKHSIDEQIIPTK